MIMFISTSYNLLANDSPEKILTDASDSMLSFEMDGSKTDTQWKDWVNNQEWSDGIYNGGVQEFEGRGLIVASGKSFTNVRIGQPGWNEARVNAYERAELAAKGEILKFFLAGTSQERLSSEIEKAQFNDGSVVTVKDINEVKATVARLVKKGVKLDKALQDAEIQKVDKSFDISTINSLSEKKQKIVVEQIFKRAITTSVMKTLTGITPVLTLESTEGNQYSVLVGVIWSPKLNRLAISLANDNYNIPSANPKISIGNWVEKMGPKLLGNWGTRIVVDEKGQYNLVAFAQAEPRKASPSRQQSSIKAAKSIAAGRARAMIARFVTETVSLSELDTSAEIFQEMEDFSGGAETIRDFRKLTSGKSKNVLLRGLKLVKEWSIDHPETGQKVAGAVVSWSPTSREMSERMENIMLNKKPKAHQQKDNKGLKSIQSSGIVIQSVPVDTSDY